MSLYISRIQIKNFRNFKALDIAISPSAVVVGENKVGKSNLLYALRLVLDASLPDSARMLRPEDFFDGLKDPLKGEVIEIAVELTGFGKNEGAKAILFNYLVEETPITARLVYQFRPKENIGERKPEGIEDYEFVVYGGLKDAPFGYQLRNYIGFIVLPALRDAEGELANWRRSPLRRLIDGLSLPTKKMKRISESLQSVTREMLKIPAIGELANSIKRQTKDMAGDLHGTEPSLGLASADPRELTKAIKLLVDGEKGRQLSEASLGTANVLFLALLMQELERKIQSKDIVSTILAIEEPEAHLHPHLQRVLFRYFLQRKHSVVVTTHSPHIASVAPIESLVALRAHKQNGSFGRTASQLELEEWERHDLQRYLDVTKAEMIFAKGVILVEGIAEEFLVPAFAQRLRLKSGEQVDLDRSGISVCAVHGTDFSPYVKLIGSEGLDIPFVVVTDGDPVLRDGSLKFRGIRRGSSLLGAEEKKEIDKLIGAEDWDACRAELANSDIFIGNRTLELDVAEIHPKRMVRAFEELPVSSKSASEFSKGIDGFLKELDDGEIKKAGEAVLGRIDRIGKGRFAQRLANKVAGQEAPDYISEAIKRIVERVREHSASA
jgi:putative ATP-dependent endonuclease of OLD family